MLGVMFSESDCRGNKICLNSLDIRSAILRGSFLQLPESLTYTTGCGRTWKKVLCSEFF